MLIHVADAGAVIAEMVRVTRLVLTAEPNNLATSLVLNSITARDPADEILAGFPWQAAASRLNANGYKNL